MGVPNKIMALNPYYSAGAYAAHGGAYGHPGFAGAGYGHPGFAGAYGPYGMTAEEIKAVREAEEKAFTEAETKRKEFMEAEKAKYEDYVAAQKKAVEDAITKEKELVEKLGAAPYGAFPGAAGYGY